MARRKRKKLSECQIGKSKSLCTLQNKAFSISHCLLRLTDIHGISMGDTRFEEVNNTVCVGGCALRMVCNMYVGHVCHMQKQ